MSYVTDRTYKSLSTRAKKMYGVVIDVRAYQDNEKCLKNQFFHAIDTLADLADLSRPHAVYALKELEQKGIITREHRHSHSTLYTYIPSENNDLTVTLRNHRTVSKSNCQTVTLRNHITTVPEQIQLTTTWLKYSLLTKAIQLHGKEWADVVVDRISRMNGKIRDKGAYFNWCIQTKIIPNSKELREKEERQRITLAVEAKRKTMLEEHEKMIREREESSGKIDLTSEFDRIITERAKIQ